jgi:hypothetical protein
VNLDHYITYFLRNALLSASIVLGDKPVAESTAIGRHLNVIHEKYTVLVGTCDQFVAGATTLQISFPPALMTK